MSIGSDIREKVDRLDISPGKRSKKLSSGAVPYLLSTADAFVIVTSSILSGIGYQLAIGNQVPNILPHCAVGLLASFIHILRMSGGGYYDFPDNAKPRVEITEILVCWLTTGLLLAFFAFLLKIGVAYSRGAFVIFYFVAPVGLLAVRNATKIALVSALDRGAIGRRDHAAAVGPHGQERLQRPAHPLWRAAHLQRRPAHHLQRHRLHHPAFGHHGAGVHSGLPHRH